MYDFDKNDVQIVNLLLEDGRMTASEISRRIRDISERMVRYRIDQMVANGVIQISAVVKPDAFGLTVKADVWLEVDSDQIQTVAKKLAKQDNITYVACGIGENDISIQLVAGDTQEIYHFITDVIRKIPGVRKTTTSIVPLIVKDVYQWRVPERVARQATQKAPGRGAKARSEMP
jgi:Lrp/AsnC family transcriptional regulator, regulator for asnA, asnC and gidA